MMVESTGTMNGWALPGVLAAICIPIWGWMWYTVRRDSYKAKTKRRMLVMEDGQLVWCTVRGALLVGSSNYGKRVVNWGAWARRTDGPDWDTGSQWAIIQTTQKKFVVYRFDKKTELAPGTIQVVDSWPELEAVVPPSIFEQALDAAGFRKPEEYREVPLKL